MKKLPLVYIITGKQGQGKTTLLRKVIAILEEAGVKVGGFTAEGTWDKGKRDGFTLAPVGSDDTMILCQTKSEKNYLQLKRFWFNPEVIKWGEQILNNCLTDESEIVVIDEIGIFELEGKVWSESLLRLLNVSDKPLIITVRSEMKEKVLKRFSLKNYSFFSVNESPATVAEVIIKALKNQHK